MATSSSSSISEKGISVSYQNSIMDAYKPIENTDTFFTNNVYIPENCEEEKILKCNNENINDVGCHLVNETFINTIKEGFELFDSTFQNLFLQQFKILDKKLTTNRIKLFIGSTADKTNPGIYGDGLYQLDEVKGVYVNFSEEIVREQMGKPIFFVQQKGGSIPEIKAMPLKDFVGKGETDEHNLLAKCAAYLLFHELFHVNTFADCEFCKDAYESNVQNFDGVVDGISVDHLKELFLNRNWGDDARNTLCKFENIPNAVPGECDFINKLYPDTHTMRLYCGKGLNFYDSAIRDNCLSVFNSVFREELSEKGLKCTPEQKLNCHIISNAILCKNIGNIDTINEIKTFFATNTQLLPQQMYHKVSQIESNLYELNKNLRKQILNNENLNITAIKEVVNNTINNLQNFKNQTINVFEGVVKDTTLFLELNDLVKFEQDILKTKLDNIKCQLQQLEALITFQPQSNENLGITVHESVLFPFEDYSSALQNLQENIKYWQILLA